MAERGIPVNIHIETRHWQDGERDDLTQDVTGHYVQRFINYIHWVNTVTK